jgi:protein-L-isoaspartate(D-aspartate) O-methyltransferase
MTAFWDRAGEVISEEQLSRLRTEMINVQIIARGVKDPLVLEALHRVKRHEFIMPGHERHAYDDGPLMIGEGQTISQPYIVALMSELAKIGPESKVLEVGTGSGYQTAVLAEIAAEVFTIEILPTLAAMAQERLRSMEFRNIHFRVGDGHLGWPEEAPFDAILVTAAPEKAPEALVDQLKEGGRMVIPVGYYSQDLQVITRKADGAEKENVIPVRFVPMIRRN